MEQLATLSLYDIWTWWIHAPAWLAILSGIGAAFGALVASGAVLVVLGGTR